MLCWLGDALCQLKELDQALNLSSQALKISREHSFREEAVMSYLNLGEIYGKNSKFKEAFYCYTKALDGATHDQELYRWKALALGGIGSVQTKLGQCRRAIKNHKRALTIKKAIGDYTEESIIIQSLGNAYFELAESYASQQKNKKNKFLTYAYRYYKQGLKIDKEIGNDEWKKVSLRSLKFVLIRKLKLSVYYNAGDYYELIDTVKQDLKLFREVGGHRAEADIWSEIGDISVKRNKTNEAMTAYKNAQKIYQAMELDHQVEKCKLAIRKLF